MTTLAKGFNFLFSGARHYFKLICNMKPTQRKLVERKTQSKLIVTPPTRNKLIWIIPGF